MNSAILTVLSLSVSGSALALILFALHPLMKNRLPKAVQYYAWLFVLLRLALPFTFEGSATDRLFYNVPCAGEVEAAQTDDAAAGQPFASYPAAVQSAAPQVTPAAAMPESDYAAVADKAKITLSGTRIKALELLETHQTAIWLTGAAISFGWFVFSYFRFIRSVKKTCVSPRPLDLAVFEKLRGKTRVRLFCSRPINTPLLIGLFSPCIVIPEFAFTENGMQNELEHILRHELTHARRLDLSYKWFSVLALSLHWFNPLVYLIRREINRACELSCDEAVIGPLSKEERYRYGNTLLGLASDKSLPAGIVATTMSEEKRSLKERLVGIMRYRKATAAVVVLSVLAMVLLAGCGVLFGAAVSPAPATTLPGRSDGPSVLQIPQPTPSAAATGTEISADTDARDAFLIIYFSSNYENRYDDWLKNTVDTDGSLTEEETAAAVTEYFACFAPYVSDSFLDTMVMNRDSIKYEAYAREKGVACVPIGFECAEYAKSGDQTTYSFVAHLMLTDTAGIRTSGAMKGQITVQPAPGGAGNAVSNFYLSPTGFVEDSLQPTPSATAADSN